jgi:oxygen-independent coproporphyrinogen-3 oxidase
MTAMPEQPREFYPPPAGGAQRDRLGAEDRAPRLGIYLHLPFCTGKCPYCSFNSQPARGAQLEAYLRALEREIELRAGNKPAADTVYFGGGTPTVFPSAALAGILRRVRAAFEVDDGAEVSIEANPESAGARALAQLREAGFNRLSVGAQSFDDNTLVALGRRHDAAQAAQAVRDARVAGWDNVSLDLMFGAPGQSPARWKATVQQAIDLRPDHVSAYCLAVEPASEFHRRGLTGAGEDAELEMYAAARAMLRAAGYEHYEVSNFALPGRRCRHNGKYWRGEDYIGLGAGAHSLISGLRWANAADPDEYAALLAEGALPVAYAERLSARRRMDEEFILALRTAEGASLPRLSVRCGRDAEGEYRTQMARLKGAGLARIEGSRLALTERGMVLANEVAAAIMA